MPEPTSQPDLVAHWKRRALQAEAAARIALWARPLTPGGRRRTAEPETADQVCARLRQAIEAAFPDLVTRSQHQRIEVYTTADSCGCDPEAEGYEAEHCESGEDGEELCSKKFLGYVCDSCEAADGDGPAWKTYGVEWPCPPIAALGPAT